MNSEITIALEPADPATFTGSAYTRLLGAADEEVPLKLYYVRFAPGARTFWHAHAGPQILLVTSGRCRYQREGEPVREAAAGSSIRFESGVRHWHGGRPEEGADHIAVNLQIRETSWFEEVSEAQYDPPPGE